MSFQFASTSSSGTATFQRASTLASSSGQLDSPRSGGSSAANSSVTNSSARSAGTSAASRSFQPGRAPCSTPSASNSTARITRASSHGTAKDPLPGAGRGSCAENIRSAGDLARLQAGGADVHALRRLADQHPDALDVRVEAPLGTTVRVRHVVSELGALVANVTNGSHRNSSGWFTRIVRSGVATAERATGQGYP